MARVQNQSQYTIETELVQYKKERSGMARVQNHSQYIIETELVQYKK